MKWDIFLAALGSTPPEEFIRDLPRALPTVQPRNVAAHSLLRHSHFEGVVPSVLELRERARRARWMASLLSSEQDRKRLWEYAEQVEAEADAIESREAGTPDDPDKA